MNTDKWMRFKIKFLSKYVTSDEYANFLRKKGIKIGKGTHFWAPNTLMIDLDRPWMIEIGEYCKITKGVTILQHDYSRSVLRRVYGDIVAESRKTIIGNNVFIGMNATVLMGATIGDNVIIGAGAIVSGNVPNNCVVAGNPARVICTLDEYYKKRKDRCIEEAVETARIFKEKNNRTPSITEMGAFFPLYLRRDISELRKYNLRTRLSGDNEKEVIDAFLDSNPVFDSYEDFLKLL